MGKQKADFCRFFEQKRRFKRSPDQRFSCWWCQLSLRNSAGYFEWKEVCQSKLLCRACIPAGRSDLGQTMQRWRELSPPGKSLRRSPDCAWVIAGSDKGLQF
jgi:hypothetical protein